MKPTPALRAFAWFAATFVATAAATFAATPRTLDEAEAFGRRVVDKYLYNEAGIVGRNEIAKMVVSRDPGKHTVTFRIPRASRSSPSFELQLCVQPHAGYLGHLRTHEPLQAHRFQDYKSDQPNALQLERYERTVPAWGEAAGCVHVQNEKIRAASTATTSTLEIQWLPTAAHDFRIQLYAFGYSYNVPKDADIGSDAFHNLVDRDIARLLVALTHAGRDTGLTSPTVARTIESYQQAVAGTPQPAPNSPALLGPREVPPLLTAATAVAAPAAPPPPVEAPPAGITLAGARQSAPPPAPPPLLHLTPAQVMQWAVQLRLVANVPAATPDVTAVRPAALPATAASAPSLLGVRGAPAPSATGAAFDEATLMALLFAPDVRLMITKEITGFGVTVYAHAKGEWAAAVIETPEGFHLPVVCAKRDFPGPLAAFLKVAAERRAPRSTELELTPLRTALLRTMFELRESTRFLADATTADLTSFTLAEIQTLLSSPRMLQSLDALPDQAQWTVLSSVNNGMLISLELAALRQRHLVQRQVINGVPRYQLSPDGLNTARLIFAPQTRLRVTRIPSSMTDQHPLINLVNTAHFTGNRTAIITYFPNGLIRFQETAWRGPAGVWALFAHLTES